MSLFEQDIEVSSLAADLAERATSLQEWQENLKMLCVQYVAEQDAWWKKSLCRALQGILDSEASFSDKGVLLREIVRLFGRAIKLPRQGLFEGTSTLEGWKRFGLRVQQAHDSSSHCFVQIDESLRSLSVDDSLWDIMRLDPKPRRLLEGIVADGALLRLSPYSFYRTSTQKAAMRALMTMPPGSTLLTTMPTGTGKSMLFRMGIRWWQECHPEQPVSALVIVPTVALALDHQRSASQWPGLEGSRAFVGGMSRDEREEKEEAFCRGEIPLLFASPEMALDSLRELLLDAAKTGDDKQNPKTPGMDNHLVAVFVDEAHIIAEWGRQFRPEFQRLSAFVECLREGREDLRCVLLSATVDLTTSALLEDLFRPKAVRKGEDSPPFLVVSAGVPRTEFDLFFHKAADRDQRKELVLELVERIPRPAILYTTRKEDAGEFFSLLKGTKGFRRIACFTGDTDAPTRESIIDQWSMDRLDLVVATSAFGMGVDKSDVRCVLHACIPESPSRYYQEIGRAARDGFQGLAICVWAEEDKVDARGMFNKQWLGKDLSKERWIAMREEAGQPVREKGSNLWLLDVPTEAVRVGLSPDTATSEKNRKWNMTLLNLMQRAGLIELLIPSEVPSKEERYRWRIRVKEDFLLAREPVCQESHPLQRLDDIVEKMLELERDQVHHDLEVFFAILEEQASRCWMMELFDLVEAEPVDLMPCGRCPACRLGEEEPPQTLQPGGRNACWPVFIPSRFLLSSGISLLAPADPLFQDGLPALISRLSQAGICQWVVPDDVSERCAILTKQHIGAQGLVVSYDLLCEGSAPWCLAEVPTAILLRANEAAGTSQKVYKFIRQKTAKWRKTALVYVAPSELHIEGRPFSQVAAIASPKKEQDLDEILQREFAKL